MYWGQGGEAGRAGEKRTPAWLEQLERGSEREILWGFCQFYVVLGLHFVGGRGGEVAGVVTVIIKVGERSRTPESLSRLDLGGFSGEQAGTYYQTLLAVGY